MVEQLGKDRGSNIKDMEKDLSIMMSQTGQYLSNHVGPEMGGLNVKQTEAILYLAQVSRRALIALTRVHKDILRLEKMLGEGVISLSVGDASITMKENGTIAIKGNDITVQGSGQVQIRAAKDLTLKGQKVHEN